MAKSANLLAENHPTIRWANMDASSTCSFIEDLDLALRKVQGKLDFCPSAELAARKLVVLSIDGGTGNTDTGDAGSML